MKNSVRTIRSRRYFIKLSLLWVAERERKKWNIILSKLLKIRFEFVSHVQISKALAYFFYIKRKPLTYLNAAENTKAKYIYIQTHKYSKPQQKSLIIVDYATSQYCPLLRIIYLLYFNYDSFKIFNDQLYLSTAFKLVT